MRLVWAVIPLVLIFFTFGFEESFAQCCLGMPSTPNPTSLTISNPPKLGEVAHVTLTATNANDIIQRHDGFTRINLPEGFELVSGYMSKTHFWKHGEQIEHMITVKAIKTGNWTIYASSGYGSGADLYVSVSKDLSYVQKERFPPQPSYAYQINPDNITISPCTSERVLQNAHMLKNPSMPTSVDKSKISPKYLDESKIPPNNPIQKYDYSDFQERLNNAQCSNVFTPHEISVILSNASDTITLSPKDQLRLE